LGIYRDRDKERLVIIVAKEKTFHKEIPESIGAENIPLVITGLYDSYEFDRIH